MEVWCFTLSVLKCTSAVCHYIQSFLHFSGAELLVEQLGPGVSTQEKYNPNIFLVGASWQRLLSGAEDLGLFKEFSDGSMRAFTCANKLNFKEFKGKTKEKTCPSTVGHSAKSLDTL